MARRLAENRIVTRHPLLVTIFANEEGGVEATLELRDLDDAKVTRLAETVMAEARKIAEGDGTKVSFRLLHENIAVPTDQRVPPSPRRRGRWGSPPR